jgi:hypothetical protein
MIDVMTTKAGVDPGMVRPPATLDRTPPWATMVRSSLSKSDPKVKNNEDLRLVM